MYFPFIFQLWKSSRQVTGELLFWCYCHVLGFRFLCRNTIIVFDDRPLLGSHIAFFQKRVEINTLNHLVLILWPYSNFKIKYDFDAMIPCKGFGPLFISNSTINSYQITATLYTNHDDILNVYQSSCSSSQLLHYVLSGQHHDIVVQGYRLSRFVISMRIDDSWLKLFLNHIYIYIYIHPGVSHFISISVTASPEAEYFTSTWSFVTVTSHSHRFHVSSGCVPEMIVTSYSVSFFIYMLIHVYECVYMCMKAGRSNLFVCTFHYHQYALFWTLNL